MADYRISSWNWIGSVGDFNGDGKPDIFWHDSLTGNNGFWWLDGTTYLSAELINLSNHPDARSTRHYRL
jgi:hypothetical protein